MQELDYLATVCANIIKAQSLSLPQALEVGAKIIVKLSTVQDAHRPTMDSVRTDTPVTVVPPPVTPRETKTLLRAGASCVCMACNVLVYRVVKDVTDPMATVDFLAAFESVGHDHFMHRDSKIRNINGNVSTDCPLCKGSFSLYLIGSKPTHDFPDDMEVSSMEPEL